MKTKIWIGLFFLMVGCSKPSAWIEVSSKGTEHSEVPPSEKDLLKVQEAELRRLKIEQKEAVRKAKQEHDIKRKEWEKAEKIARHAYFEKHPKGIERRAYIQDFLKRREAFFRGLSEDLKSQEKQHEEAFLEMKRGHELPRQSQNL